MKQTRMFAATCLVGGRAATALGSVTRRRIATVFAPALAVLGLMVAPGTPVSATPVLAAQTFSCSPSFNPNPRVTVPLSGGGSVTLIGEEFEGHYSGITVQPSSTGVTAAGIEAQCLLARSNFSPGAIDGIFGPNSQLAAKHFQAKVDSACHGVLTQDGLVGPKTWPWLRFYAAPPIGCDGA